MSNNIQKWVSRFVLLITIASIIAACSGPLNIVKRRYEPGYYLQWTASKGHTNTDAQRSQREPLLIASSDKASPVYLTHTRETFLVKEETSPQDTVLASDSAIVKSNRTESSKKIAVDSGNDLVSSTDSINSLERRTKIHNFDKFRIASAVLSILSALLVGLMR